MLLVVVLAALGAAQAAFLLCLIAFRYRHHKNVPLALLLLVFSLRLATIPTWNAEILLAYPWLIPATTPLPFLFGPLLWWYVREISSKTSATPRRPALHFAPYLLGVAVTGFALLRMEPASYQQFIRDVFAGAPPAWMLVENALKVAVNTVYLALAGRIAFGRGAQRLARRRRMWAQALVVVPAAVLAAFAYVALLPGATAELAAGVAIPFAVLAFSMVALIYLISLMVIVAPELPGEVAEAAGRQGEGTLSEEECRLLVDRVERLLASGELQDPDLSLPDVAMQLKVHPNRLSYAINHAEGLSFRRFVNRHRIAHFIEEVESGALEESTILGLAFDVGFPSKSTFNRVFKEEVGTTPSDFVAGGRRRFGI
jgi:AraC-like DNA-binding protein